MQGGGRQVDVLGHYHLLERLGVGASATVYRALDVTLDREVALKVLRADALSEEGSRRLGREARLLARLNHPNVETVYEFGSTAGLEYLAVELVTGPTLAELAHRAPLPEAEIRHIGVQLAEGLQAAHSQGIIHCDLKPANLRLTPEGRLKILDFGIARLRQEWLSATLSTARTQEEAYAIGGTPAYMAPEQLDGQADERSDVYAAGAVLYELATGRRPFTAPVVTALLNAVATEDPPPVRRLNPAVSGALEATIHRALRKRPDARHQTAAALKDALAGRPVGPSVRRRRLWGAGLAGAAAVAMTGVVLGLAWSGRAEDDASAPVGAALRERRITAFPDDLAVGSLVPTQDGQEIVYDVGEEVARRAVDGGPPAQIATPPECEHFRVRGILEDGTTLAANCVRRSDEGRLQVVPVALDERGGARPLAPPGKLESVAPDGRHLQVQHDAGVFVRNVDSGEERRVLSLGPSEHATCSSWSPDSKYLALGIVRLTDTRLETRIDVVSRDGRRADTLPVERLLQPAGVCGVTWASTDTLLYATVDEADSGSVLWEAHLSGGAWDGRPPRRLYAWPDASVEWLAFSEGRLLFVKDAGGQADLRVVDVTEETVDLERALRVTHNDTHDAGAWTPDGRIYFSSNRYGTWDAFLKAPEDDRPELVAGGPDDEMFDASLGDGRFLFWRVARADDEATSLCRLMEVDRPGGASREIGTYGTAFRGIPGLEAPCPTVWCPRGEADRCLLVRVGASELLFQRIDLETGRLDEAFRRPTPSTLSWDISPDGRSFVLTPPDRPAVAVIDIDTGETVERKVEMPPGLEDTALLDAGWAWDGSGWYAVENSPTPKRLLFVDGRTYRARVVAESHTPEFMRWPWSSPDGRRIVVTTFWHDIDVWMLEGLQ